MFFQTRLSFLVEMMGFAPSLSEAAPLPRRLGRANRYKRATGTFACAIPPYRFESLRPMKKTGSARCQTRLSFLVEMMGFEPTAPTLRT